MSAEPANPQEERPRSIFGTDDRTGETVRALVLLGLCGGSIALGLGHALTIGAAKFLRANEVPHVVRVRLLLCVLVGGFLAAGAGAAWLLRKRDTERLARFARLCSPLALSAAVPVVLALESWTDTLTTALACASFIIILELTLRGTLATVTLRDLRIPKWVPIATVALLSIAYAAYMSHYTVNHHRRWNTMAYDLGQFDNEFYNALHGHPFRCTALIRAGDWSELRNHASFSIYALLPFYAIKPGAETLLRIQAVLLAAAAIPLYAMTARRLGRGFGLLIAIAYLAYPPLHGANFYDFHFQPVAAAFSMFALDALDRKQHWLFGILFALALGCREDTSVGWAVFGAFMILTGWRPRTGLLIAGISTLYFVVVKFVVMPHFGQWWFSDIYKGLYPAGESDYGGVIKTILTNPGYVFRTWISPQKLSYAVLVLLPVLFLPLRRKMLWLLCVPGAFFTLLTTDYTPTTSIGFQYSAYWIPWIFFGAALALAAMEPLRRRAAAVALGMATLLCTFHWGAIPARKDFRAGFFEVSFEKPDERMVQKERDLQALMAMVPRSAPIAVSERELPHVSTRLNCYSLRDGIEGAEWILYSTDMGGMGSGAGVDARNKHTYDVVAEKPGLVLLKRAAADREP